MFRSKPQSCRWMILTPIGRGESSTPSRFPAASLGARPIMPARHDASRRNMAGSPLTNSSNDANAWRVAMVRVGNPVATLTFPPRASPNWVSFIGTFITFPPSYYLLKASNTMMAL